MRDFIRLPSVEQPHVMRLQRLVPLNSADIDALLAASGRALEFGARSEIVRVGEITTGPRILTAGWAAQVRDFPDGRRQILHLLLPGDMISIPQKLGAFAATTIVAVTDTSIALAPKVENYNRGLGLGYALSADIERICLQRQIARIGRLGAYERLADFFLELLDRLEHAGLAVADSFQFPLTQEMLADSLGITTVHVNRTLQQMRRESMIDDRERTLRLMDVDSFRSLVDYQPLATSVTLDG